MKRQNLVLVHSFPTNRTLLQGLVDFLEDYFTVHFVNLPGFALDVPPLDVISVANYSGFLRQHVEQLGLKEYLLAGISFGFLVVNHAPPSKNCKAILAMEPFVGANGLRATRHNQPILRLLLGLLSVLHAERLLWNSRFFRDRLSKSGPPDRIETLLSELDPRTFVETARMLLNWREPVRFHNIPYILLLNPVDQTINADYVLKVFEKGASRLLVVPNQVEHYPRTLTKEYFESRIAPPEIDRILSFLEKEAASAALGG